jgi:hypothetical protein
MRSGGTSGTICSDGTEVNTFAWNANTFTSGGTCHSHSRLVECS